MKRTITRQAILVPILLVLCLSNLIAQRRSAPPFTAQTLDGETFSNESLSGRVTLLQFWATWCRYCRSDQSAVDNVERSYASKGLVVLAIDVGESETAVRSYLQRSPRACRVVVNQGNALAARFGAGGFPYYVLIDEQGRIAGTQDGAAGEASLRGLLRRAGFTPQSAKVGTRQHTSIRSQPGTVKIIEVPGVGTAPSTTWPPPTGPKTIFIFSNGERIEADQYTIDPATVQLVVGDQHRKYALSTVDVQATIAANRSRGVVVQFPKRENEVFVAF
jgi:thiol-disulfide isomerase/thioredoxin